MHTRDPLLIEDENISGRSEFSNLDNLGPGARNAVKGRVPCALELKVQLKEEFTGPWS